MTTQLSPMRTGRITASRVGAILGDERLPERFWSKVAVAPETGCWEWVAYRHPSGYGMFGVAHARMKYAHRVAYETLTGPVPLGLVLDHLCRVRHCVNPGHLEPVSFAENVRRGAAGAEHAAKTHCAHGHAFDDANTAWVRGKRGKPERHCRTCDRDRARRRREARSNDS